MSRSNIDPNTRRISGPINILRLEGDIHGIKKVIYIFMDYHMDVKNQTQCANIFSKDVQKYFAQNFYKLNKSSKVYDFFLEVYPTELADRERLLDKQIEYKDMYIEEVVKFFRKIFVYDSQKNKVLVNKLFQNLRLHYMDIRDYYTLRLLQQFYEMNDIAYDFQCDNRIEIDGLERIIELLRYMRYYLDSIVSILSKSSFGKKTQIIQKESHILNTEALEYLSYKIRQKYKYEDVRDKMNKLINQSVDNLLNLVTSVDAAVKQFKEYADYLKKAGHRLIKDENTTYIFNYGPSVYTVRKMIVDIANRLNMLIDDNFIEYFARFTDIYFLRRFLDKDYITNAITYTGALHSTTYVYELVHTFDFQVTHASYSKIKDLKKLTQEIKEKSLLEIQELIYPPKIHQCSDMSHFPEDFL